MKKSVYFLIIISFITLSASLVVAKKHIQHNPSHDVSVKVISQNTNCILSKRSLKLERGLRVHARSGWNFKTYLPDYKCFVPSSSIE